MMIVNIQLYVFNALVDIDNNQQIKITSKNKELLSKISVHFSKRDIRYRAIMIYYITDENYYIELSIIDSEKIQMSIYFNNIQFVTDTKAICKLAKNILEKIENKLTSSVKKEIACLSNNWKTKFLHVCY